MSNIGINLGDINNQIEFILTFFGDYSILGIFFATLLLGEIVIFFAFLLSQQGVFDFSEVFIIAIIALFSVDLFWFFVGRYFPQRHIPIFLKVKVLKPVKTFLTSFTNNKMLLSIITLKFFIGIRIAYMLYLSKQEISVKTLIVYDIFAVIVFVLFLSFLGVFLGGYIKDAFSSYIYLASFATGITFFIFTTVVSKLFIKYNNSINISTSK